MTNKHFQCFNCFAPRQRHTAGAEATVQTPAYTRLDYLAAIHRPTIELMVNEAWLADPAGVFFLPER